MASYNGSIASNPGHGREHSAFCQLFRVLICALPLRSWQLILLDIGLLCWQLFPFITLKLLSHGFDLVSSEKSADILCSSLCNVSFLWLFLRMFSLSTVFSNLILLCLGVVFFNVFPVLGTIGCVGLEFASNMGGQFQLLSLQIFFGLNTAPVRTSETPVTCVRGYSEFLPVHCISVHFTFIFFSVFYSG